MYIYYIYIDMINCIYIYIVHLVAKLDSLFNVIYRHSISLLSAASKCPTMLVRAVFRDPATVCYSFSGYNKLFSFSHLKNYDFPISALC